MKLKMKTTLIRRKALLILILIVILAVFLRLWQIGVVPPSPDWDEAALGYNAYSIMLTGKDEYGKMLPVVLQSFDDYKPALYAYLIIPFIKIFDLSIISVRLPSILFGIISVFTVFFLVKLVLGVKEVRMSSRKISSDTIALTSAFLFTISPWHIQFSRVGFEAQVGLSLDLLAITFFFLSLRKKWFLTWSVVFAVVSIYVYQSEKLYIPLLFAVLLIIYGKNLLSYPRKILVLSFMTGLILILPMVFYVATSPNALLRAKGVSIFAHETKMSQESSRRLDLARSRGDTLGQILDNRRITYARQITAAYLSHFEPNWLFLRGDGPRHQAPYMGLLYVFEIPLILIGIYGVAFLNFSRKSKFFIFSYFLIAPIPAAITIDVPHAVRTLHFLPAFQIFAAFGLLMAFALIENKIRVKVVKLLIYAAFGIFVLLNFSYYLNQYFSQQNYFVSQDWQYGWKEAVDYAWVKHDKFNQVIVSNVPPLDQSYIFFLYYLKYDPFKYQKSGGTQSGGFLSNHKNIENIIFRPINWVEDDHAKSTLFLGRPEDLPVNIDKTIYLLNGDPVMEFSEKP